MTISHKVPLSKASKTNGNFITIENMQATYHIISMVKSCTDNEEVEEWWKTFHSIQLKE